MMQYQRFRQNQDRNIDVCQVLRKPDIIDVAQSVVSGDYTTLLKSISIEILCEMVMWDAFLLGDEVPR